jgi:hypothetical protein
VREREREREITCYKKEIKVGEPEGGEVLRERRSKKRDKR